MRRRRHYQHVSYLDKAREDLRKYSDAELHRAESDFAAWSAKEGVNPTMRERYGKLLEVTREEIASRAAVRADNQQ